MIFVDRFSMATPSIFFSGEIKEAKRRIAEFYESQPENSSQDRFSFENDRSLTAFYFPQLVKLFRSKCAYCESRIEFSGEMTEVDHFRPRYGARGLRGEFSREHYWWLAYEWRNIYLACTSCMRFKSSWFPVNGPRLQNKEYRENLEIPLLLDPCQDQPEHHFLFQGDGRIRYQTGRAEITGDILKLNRSTLVEMRKQQLNRLEDEWKHLLLRRNELDDSSEITKIFQSWWKIFDGSSEQPFLQAQRQFLQERLKAFPDIAAIFESNRIRSEDQTSAFSTTSQQDPDAEQFKPDEVLLRKNLRHVYLDRIELCNYACFKNLVVKFKDTANRVGDQTYEPWLLFLGDNGVGKSSLLKAIALALMGDDYRKRIGVHANPQRLLKKGTRQGYIRLYLNADTDPIEILFSDSQSELKCTHPDPITYVVGYGSIRLLPNGKIQPEKNPSSVIKTRNLFDYSISLVDVSQWLLQQSDERFESAALALKDLMLLKGSDRILRLNDKKTVGVLLHGEEEPIPIEDLSDGYKTALALAVDIMATLTQEKVSYDLAEGIVLIDEIGTHLHPRWKMEVVQRLRNCFPKIQFIVTTHEPLCLQGMKEGEVVVLSRTDAKDIIALTELPDPSRLRVDQILTSEFFGLKSAIDPKTEAIFEEYYQLLSIDENERTEEQRNRLLSLSETVPRMKHLGDNLREEIIYYIVDELLAKRTKTEGLQIRENLKEEAKDRVVSLWNLVSNNEHDLYR